MPRPRKHPHASQLNPNGIPDPGSSGSADVAGAGLRAYANATERPYDAVTALLDLCSRGDGWIRIVPHEFGKTVFCKYKFTVLPWHNHYVMWRQDGGDITEMLWGLLRKVELVDAGELRPIYDVPYSGM